MDLLLDVNVVVDVCTGRQQDCSNLAIAKCLSEGGRPWLYAGSAQTLEYVTRHELRRQHLETGKAVTARQIGWMSQHGERLDLPLNGNAEAVCPSTGLRFRLRDGNVEPLEAP